MRQWPWLLLLPLLLLRTAAAMQRPSVGLSASVARALRRIRDSPRDVRLSDDLWFEALPSAAGPRPGPAEAAGRDGDLLRLADGVFDTHRLRWRDAVASGVDVAVRKERRRYVLDVQTARRDAGDANTRTFGLHRRRMQLVMLPIMYKLGVITTLLTGLTVLSLKGVTIGVILLILAATSFAARASKFGGHHASYYGPPPPSSYSYDPFDRSSPHHPFPSPSAPDKNIHVHLHTGPGTSDRAAVSSAGVAYAGGPRPAVGQADDGAYDDGWYRAATGADEYGYDAGHRGRPADADGSGRPSAVESTGGGYHRWLG